jgi:hypothetical protein
MSTVLVSATDPRAAKAVALATDSGQWLKCRAPDGRTAYGVPSSQPGRYYLTTRSSCDCYDARRHECKHQLAVRLHCALVAEQRQAANAEKYDDIFTRFDDDPAPLARILGGPAPYVTNHMAEPEPEPLCGPLCGAQASRNRVCAAPAYHTGAHVFVPQVERED